MTTSKRPSGYKRSIAASVARSRSLSINRHSSRLAYVLVCPPALTPALPTEFIEGTPRNFADMKIMLPYTVPYNLAGLPALTLPSGFRGDGIPLAVQLVAAHFRKALILRAGHAFENATDHHRRHPKP